MLQCVELKSLDPLHLIQALHLQDRKLKFFFGINSLISYNLGYSEMVSQLSIVMLQKVENCRLYVTKMKTMNFQVGIFSIPIDNFNDHYVLVFELTSMRDATENCLCRELVGEPLKLELNFTFPLEHVAELILMGKRTSSVAVDKFGVVGKSIENG